MNHFEWVQPDGDKKSTFIPGHAIAYAELRTVKGRPPKAFEEEVKIFLNNGTSHVLLGELAKEFWRLLHS